MWEVGKVFSLGFLVLKFEVGFSTKFTIGIALNFNLFWGAEFKRIFKKELRGTTGL